MRVIHLFLTIVIAINLVLSISCIEQNDNEQFQNNIELTYSNITQKDNKKESEKTSKNFVNDLFEIKEPEKTVNINIKNKQEIESIKGNTYYYKVIVSDETTYQKNNEMNESYYLSYSIDYENKYNTLEDVKNTQFCKITYKNSSLAIKEEYFNEDNELLYILIRDYDENSNKIINEKDYDNNYNLVNEREFDIATGKIKKEKIFDNTEKLSYIKLYSYNNYTFLIQETLLNSQLEQLEIKRYVYDNNKLIREIFYSGEGIRKSETLYKDEKPISIVYYDKRSNILYEEQLEYYKNSSSIKIKKNINSEGKIIRLEKYDKKGYQKEVIDYDNDEYEKKVFIYKFISEIRVIDKIKIYKKKSHRPIEIIDYFYNEFGEMNNWIKYNTEGELISSMDNKKNYYKTYYYDWYDKW